MAKIKKNIVLEGVSGTIGKDYYVRIRKDGKTIISLKPDFSNRQFSQAQLDNQERTKQAAAYAKAVYKTNPIYAEKTRGTAMNAYNLALRDWRRPPVIESMSVGLDGTIRVGADDDVMVTRVVVSILDESGQPLEQGEATLVMGVWWDYRPMQTGLIRVEARDLAGNVTRQEYRRSHPILSNWEEVG